MITIIAKTINGTEYRFCEREGRTIFRRGYVTMGEVVRIKNGPISVGKPIEIDYCKKLQCGKPEGDTMFCNTPPVREIVVVFQDTSTSTLK